MKKLLFAVFLCLSTPVYAEEIVTPQEFKDISEGKTLYFSRDGRLFGIEQFYKRHRSTWQFADGECDDGVWYPQGDYICFQYTKNPDAQCWTFLKTDKGYVARAQGAGPEFDLFLRSVDQEPLNCKGPDVGA